MLLYVIFSMVSAFIGKSAASRPSADQYFEAALQFERREKLNYWEEGEGYDGSWQGCTFT